MRYLVNLRECLLNIVDAVQASDALARQRLVLQMQVTVAMTAVETLNGLPTA